MGVGEMVGCYVCIYCPVCMYDRPSITSTNIQPNGTHPRPWRGRTPRGRRQPPGRGRGRGSPAPARARRGGSAGSWVWGVFCVFWGVLGVWIGFCVGAGGGATTTDGPSVRMFLFIYKHGNGTTHPHTARLPPGRGRAARPPPRARPPRPPPPPAASTPAVVGRCRWVLGGGRGCVCERAQMRI